MINKEDLDWESQLENAQAYFSHRYKDDATLEIILAKDTFSAGTAHPESVKLWREYLEYRYEKIDKKTASFLRGIQALNFPAWLLGILEWDLDVEKNEMRFQDLVSEKFSGEKENLLGVLVLAKEAHSNQSQMRPKDIERGDTTLGHIPYVNHPIQIANLAFQKNLSSDAIRAALLHDVIEDTSIDDKQLRARGIHETVIELVKHLSRNKNTETREQFLARSIGLSGEVLILKCLDRFHNLIRSFGIKDPEYLKRYIDESKMFVPIFQTQPLLADIAPLFNQLLKELERYRGVFVV